MSKRESPLAVRMSSAEKRIIDKTAKALGTNRNRLIRRVLLQFVCQHWGGDQALNDCPLNKDFLQQQESLRGESLALELLKFAPE